MQHVGRGSSGSFWDEFKDLENKLADCLSNFLVLEELRANFFVFYSLSPEMKTTFMNKIYGQKSKSSKKERELFNSLQSVTGGRPGTPTLLTLLAECLDPHKPVSQLEQIQNFLKAESAHMWTDEKWVSWFQQWRRLDSWDNILNIIDSLDGKAYTLLPKVMLSGTADGMVTVACLETMRLPVFNESIRQQLALLLRNPELVYSLICPFKGRRRYCCGFGHLLQNIWAAVPNEERRRLKPPSKVCLNCAPLSSH